MEILSQELYAVSHCSLWVIPIVIGFVAGMFWFLESVHCSDTINIIVGLVIMAWAIGFTIYLGVNNELKIYGQPKMRYTCLVDDINVLDEYTIIEHKDKLWILEEKENDNSQPDPADGNVCVN